MLFRSLLSAFGVRYSPRLLAGAVIRLAEGGMGLRPAWETAAADVWVERICPLKGAELDPEVRSKLASFVSLNAPATIR